MCLKAFDKRQNSLNERYIRLVRFHWNRSDNSDSSIMIILLISNKTITCHLTRVRAASFGTFKHWNAFESANKVSLTVGLSERGCSPD